MYSTYVAAGCLYNVNFGSQFGIDFSTFSLIVSRYKRDQEKSSEKLLGTVNEYSTVADPPKNIITPYHLGLRFLCIISLR